MDTERRHLRNPGFPLSRDKGPQAATSFPPGLPAAQGQRAERRAPRPGDAAGPGLVLAPSRAHLGQGGLVLTSKKSFVRAGPPGGPRSLQTTRSVTDICVISTCAKASGKTGKPKAEKQNKSKPTFRLREPRHEDRAWPRGPHTFLSLRGHRSPSPFQELQTQTFLAHSKVFQRETEPSQEVGAGLAVCPTFHLCTGLVREPHQ